MGAARLNTKTGARTCPEYGLGLPSGETALYRTYVVMFAITLLSTAPLAVASNDPPSAQWRAAGVESSKFGAPNTNPTLFGLMRRAGLTWDLYPTLGVVLNWKAIKGCRASAAEYAMKMGPAVPLRMEKADVIALAHEIGEATLPHVPNPNDYTHCGTPTVIYILFYASGAPVRTQRAYYWSGTYAPPPVPVTCSLFTTDISLGTVAAPTISRAKGETRVTATCTESTSMLITAKGIGPDGSVELIGPGLLQAVTDINGVSGPSGYVVEAQKGGVNVNVGVRLIDRSAGHTPGGEYRGIIVIIASPL